jgi:hypothetical protein
MSQFGMQMPGGGAQRAAGMNVYTGLLGAAALAMLAASVFVFMQARTIAPQGNAFSVHEYDANTKTYKITLPDTPAR